VQITELSDSLRLILRDAIAVIADVPAAYVVITIQSNSGQRRLLASVEVEVVIQIPDISRAIPDITPELLNGQLQEPLRLELGLSLSSDVAVTFGCSAGRTQSASGECQPCAPGTYKEAVGSEQCTLCREYF
jgi:hypothetical protein